MLRPQDDGVAIERPGSEGHQPSEGTLIHAADQGADAPRSTEYSVRDLAAAAAAARDALGCPECKSTGLARAASGRESAQRCPICRGTGGTGITAEVYGKLCRLADVVTRVDPADEGVLAAKEGLESLLRKAADRPEKQTAIGRHAAQRIAASAGSTGGMLVIGTIDRKEQLGSHYVTRLVLLGDPTPVLVLSESPMPFQPGELVLVAGSMATGDLDRVLAGYQGPREPVIQGGMPLRLAE
jgi:hypothetical protein